MDNYTVLAVNDKPEQLELLETLLTDAGFNVLKASSGREGYKIARKQKPDLIISDVIMPEGGGIELCRLVRADQELSFIPVMLASALQKDTESIVQGLEFGADDYLELPYEPMRLAAKATRLIERKRMDDALRQSENRFRSLIENLTDIISILTPDGTILYESPSLENILGFKPEELVGKNAFELVHPEDEARVMKYFREAIKNPEAAQSVEYRFRHKNNSWRIIESVGKSFDDPANGLVAIINSRDVTERKQVEAALRFQKTLLEAQSEASIDGILVISEGKEIIFCNQRFAEMWGISKDEPTGKSKGKYLKLIVDQLVDPQEFLETVSYLDEHPFAQDQLEFYLKDGRIFEWYTAPVMDADETHFGRVWFFRDTTKRQLVEEAIRFQAHLLDTVQQAVIATDSGGIVTYWNQFARNLYGWKSEEAVGRSIIELTTPEVGQEQAIEIMSQLNKGKSWSGEFTVKNKQGMLFPAHVTNSPVYDGEGKLIGIVGISIDISERKRAEKAIAEANKRAIHEYDRLLQKLTSLAQTSAATRNLNTVFRGIFEFTKDTVPCTGFFITLYDHKNQQRTPAFAVTDGEEYDVSSFPPMAMTESPHSRAVSTGEVIIENDFQAAMVGQPVVNIGMEKDPSLPQSCLVTPMTMMGRIIGAVEVQSTRPAAYTPEHATVMQMAANIAANAIENLRLLEEEQYRTEQSILSQRLESVGRLAGGIAHDFNNMLTAINGYSELTLRRLKEDDPLRHNIEEIKKAGERSAALTHQLLAFSRKQVLKPKVLDLNEVIIDTSKMLQRLIGEDIQLSLVSDAKLGLVEADPGQLTQVIMNLAVNARDAMPNGGSLIIETTNISLDKEYVNQHFTVRAGSYVMLAVSDNGIGMDEETQQFIFEPFFTTKEIGKGTGLGLATVYGIVKQSGGYIWVYSELGKGTTFKIYLPRVDEDVLLIKENKQLENIPQGTETILLVEDEEMVRNLSHQILKTCGYRVLEASNGVEALSICQNSNSKIDLLMTDVVMPQMGGRELAEKLAEMYPQIRLLYTSGYTDDAIIRQGVIETGANFIQKPFTFEALAKKVRELLDAKKEK